MSEEIMGDSSFSIDDRNRIQAIKAQLQWKCVNKQQGNQFRLSVNPYKKTHTIFFPTNTAYNPTLYHYLLELSRAFYAERYGAIFGDAYFHPKTPKEVLPVYGSLISSAQHWFTSHFCHANFDTVWMESLNIKYNNLKSQINEMIQDLDRTLSASLIMAQIASLTEKNSSTLVQGTMQHMVNAFLRVDPRAVSVPAVAALANGLVEFISPETTITFNSQDTGGFWQSHSVD